jgi:glycosyltransferase involved in cell wall biosynthesis
VETRTAPPGAASPSAGNGFLVLNQFAGSLVRDLCQRMGAAMGPIAVLAGTEPDLPPEETGSVKFHRARSYDRRGYGRRAVSWMLYFGQAVVWILRRPRDIPVLFYSNPPMLPWLGPLIRLRGQRYAVIVFDIYPDVLVGLKKLRASSLIVRMWTWLNRIAYSRAEVVMTLGPCMASRLSDQFDPASTRAGRIEVIYPWADTSVITPLPKEQNWFAGRHEQVGRLTVLYSGNMGWGHDIETMLGTARRLREVDEIHFLFVGGGPKWSVVEAAVRESQLGNVTLLPWQPEEVLPYSLATGDVALVSLEPGMEGLAIPSKAFSALAAGMPLVAIGTRADDLARIIERFRCGWVVPRGGVDELSEILLMLNADRETLREYQMRGRTAAEEIGSLGNADRVAARLHEVFCLRPGAGPS